MNLPILSIITLTPVIGAIIIMIIPEKEHKLIKYTALLASGVSLFFSLYVYYHYDKIKGGLQFLEEIPWISKFGISYSMGVDGISIPLIILTALVIFTGIFSSWKLEKRPKEFFVFLLILVAGTFGVFCTRDLFFFYLFFEIAVIPMFILIGVWGSIRKEYAAMKLTLYLIIGSAFALIAIIAIYLNSGIGTFDIESLTQQNYDPRFQRFAFFLLIIGFGFLVPMWPLHTWSPDGHVAAPTAVSMLHAGVLMKLGGYGLVRAGIFIFPEGVFFWSPLIAFLCIINVVYGAFVAMVQKDLKFVIGYSSVSHMGCVLLGIAAMGTISITGAVAQMFAHGIMTALFFSLVGVIYENSHTREIARFGGLAQKMPRVATGFLIAGLASLGLPGLVNFIAEFLIFTGSYPVYKVFSILAVSGIVVTAIYVLRVYQNVFFGPLNSEWENIKDANNIQMIPVVILSFVLITLGFIPSLLIEPIANAVEPLVDLYLGTIVSGGGIQ